MVVKDKVVRISTDSLLKLQEIDKDIDDAVTKLYNGVEIKKYVEMETLLKLLASMSGEILDRIDLLRKQT